MSHYPKNARGEHLDNVDIAVSRGMLGGARITVYSIVDLPGSDYEEATHDLLFAISTYPGDWVPDAEVTIYSYKHLEELLEEVKPDNKANGLIHMAALAGLAIVRMAERKAPATV